MWLLSLLSKMMSCNSELLFLTSSYFDWKSSSDCDSIVTSIYQNAELTWVPTKFLVRKCRRSTSILNLSQQIICHISHHSSFQVNWGMIEATTSNIHKLWPPCICNVSDVYATIYATRQIPHQPSIDSTDQ